MIKESYSFIVSLHIIWFILVLFFFIVNFKHEMHLDRYTQKYTYCVQLYFI